MNAKERAEWLRAVRACLPDADTRPMAEAAEALEAACPGRWEVSVGGGGLGSAGLRFFGAGPYAPWRAAAAEAFSYDEDMGPDAPREGFPWLSAVWDLKKGSWTAARLTGAAKGVKLRPGRALAWDFKPDGDGPVRRELNPVPFKAAAFSDPVLIGALEDFAALCPLSSMSIEDAGWSLRFARPLRWPRFARCDAAAAFAPHSAQLALFMLDRSVGELSFDGEALWAHCGG